MSAYRRAVRLYPEGDEGPTEVFDVRISEQGFIEWAQQREMLREMGYPDRPPDVDTPTLQAWVPHPGEEDHPYFRNHPVPSPEEADILPFRVYSITWTARADGSRMAWLVAGGPDGSFEVNVESDVGVAFQREYPKEMDPDAVGADMDTVLAELSERIPDAVVRVTTYAEYLDFDAQMAEAVADIERGFINPLPEGPIQ